MNNEIVLLRRIEELEKLIQRQPEVGGVWQDWTPSYSGYLSMTVSLVTNYFTRYRDNGDDVDITLFIRVQTGGTASRGIYITTPSPLSRYLVK